jgi:hypothetical protein
MPASRQREIVAGGPKAVIAAAKKSKRRRAPGAAAAATNYQPETEQERDLRILQSCFETTCPAARREFLEDIADEIGELQLFGTPKETCEAVLLHHGVDQTKKVVRELDKRVRNLKPDCLACRGTGFAPMDTSTACGMPIAKGVLFPCDCSPAMQGMAGMTKKTACAGSIDEVPPNDDNEHRAA